MTTIATVSAIVDERIEAEAIAVCASYGLTLSEAFRLLLVRTATDHAFPFEPFVPNEETIAAMREAERGELVAFASVAELMADLNADD